MSIVESKQENTIVLSDTIFFQDVTLGITLTDITKAEVIISARPAQAIGQTRNYCVTGQILSTSTIRIQRGFNLGAMVITFEVVEYKASSGMFIDSASASFSSNPTNIAIPSRDRTKRYCRVNIRSTINNVLQTQMLSFFVDSDTNLKVEGDVAASNITVEYQVIFIPDQTVDNLSGLATGTNFDIDVTSLGLTATESFVIQSMHYGGTGAVFVDEFKGAELNTNTNLRLYSFFSDSMNFKTQIISTARNFVQRTRSVSTATPFNVVVVTAVVLADSFINSCTSYNYFTPTADSTNNSQEFAFTTTFSSTTTHVAQKFLGGKSSDIVTEVVEIGELVPVGGGSLLLIQSRHRRKI